MTEKRFFWSTDSLVYEKHRDTHLLWNDSCTWLFGRNRNCGTTFYSFVIENLSNIGALKAIGASNSLLYKMIALQAFIVGVIGYGIGLGLAATFGFLVQKGGQPPFYMPIEIPLFTFFMIFFICLFSASLAIHRISKVETAEVFRG